MKVYPKKDILNLKASPQSEDLLNEYRLIRKFNPELFFQYKSKALLTYLEKTSLRSFIVGVSGGIDSAVVLAFLSKFKQKNPSALDNVIPIYMPVYNGSSCNQEDSLEKVQELCKQFGLDLVELDLTRIHLEFSHEIESSLKRTSTPWAKGQFVAHCRTPSLYYAATLVTANGSLCAIAGTTNKDEGFYLGYVGKASDGLVDVQFISDLHKSEVNSLGAYLGVPTKILKATPRGDLYDNRSDEELFGASYDFVEMYHYYKQIYHLIPEKEANAILKDDFFLNGSANLENLHSYNKHKYFCGSPAIHLDVIPDILKYHKNSHTWKTNLDYDGQYFFKSLNKHQFKNLKSFLIQQPLSLVGKKVIKNKEEFYLEDLELTFGIFNENKK